MFSLSPVGNTWTFKVVYSITGPEGCGPLASLTLDDSGNLYGTTYCGGAFGAGSVFRLANTRNGWAYTSLYDFTRGDDGGNPISQVTIAADGTLYGTAAAGGSFEGVCAEHQLGCGTIWMIKP